MATEKTTKKTIMWELVLLRSAIRSNINTITVVNIDHELTNIIDKIHKDLKYNDKEVF